MNGSQTVTASMPSGSTGVSSTGAQPRVEPDRSMAPLQGATTTVSSNPTYSSVPIPADQVRGSVS
jgi:hypothetical protein